MQEENYSISEYLDRLNSIVEDIESHPVKVDKNNLPSNLEVIIRGVSDSKALDFLFSTKLDKFVDDILNNIENGNIEKALSSEDTLVKTFNAFFGDKAFRGPVSNVVLSSVQASVQSTKFKSFKSGMVGTLKKLQLINKNLKKAGKQFKDDKELKKKYDDTIYALKRLLKIVHKIYKNRNLVNNRLYVGLNNLVNEGILIDAPLERIEL